MFDDLRQWLDTKEGLKEADALVFGVIVGIAGTLLCVRFGLI